MDPPKPACLVSFPIKQSVRFKPQRQPEGFSQPSPSCLQLFTYLFIHLFITDPPLVLTAAKPTLPGSKALRSPLERRVCGGSSLQDVGP